MKFIRLIIIILVVITLILPIMAFTALSLYGIDQLKPLLITAVEKKTGRTLLIHGEMSATLALNPTITLTDIRLSNPSWSEQQDMMSIDEAKITLDLVALLDRRIAIDDVHLRGGSVYLQQNGHQQNWVFDDDTPLEKHEYTDTQHRNTISKADHHKIALQLDSISLEKVTVIYQRNHQTPHRVYISQTHAEISPDMSAVVHFTYQDGIKGRLTLDSEASDIAELLTKSADMQLYMEAPQSSMVIAGKAKSFAPLRFTGTIKADSASLHHFLSILYAQETHPTPPVAWESTIKVNDQQIVADMIKARYGDTELNGDMTLDISSKIPQIHGNVLIPRFVIASTPQTTAEPQISNQIVEQKETDHKSIDMSWLKQFDGTLKMQLASLIKDNTEIASNIMLHSSITGLILSVTDYRGNLLDGTFSGNAMLDASNPSLHVTLKSHIYDISVEKISQYLNKNNAWRGGALDAELAFTTVGNTQQELLHHLNGTVNYTLAKTQFMTPEKARDVGNFFNALRNMQTEGKTIDIQCGIGTWNIEQGVATADIALFDTATAIVDIRGFIALLSKELALTVFAHPKHPSFVNIPIPIRVTGTLNELDIKADSKALLRSFGNVLAVLKEKSHSINAALGSSLAERLKQKDMTHSCFADIPASLTNPQPTTKQELKQIEKDVKKDFKEMEHNVRDVRDNLKQLFGE